MKSALHRRLLRWGTHTAAELAAADHADAGTQLAAARPAAPPRLLPWESSTAADPAAATVANAAAQITSLAVTRQLEADTVVQGDIGRPAAKLASK